jgi:hypothetical protein
VRAGIANLAVWAFWTRDAEASASSDASASCYGRSEDVLVLAIVMAELKLIQVQRQVFFADVMIRTDHASLKQRPERLDIVCVNLTPDILAFAVGDHFMRQRRFEQTIAAMFISCDERHFIANCLANESIEGRSVCVLDDFANHVTLAGDRTDDRGLVAHLSAPDVGFLIPVAVLIFAADESFVYFDDSHELFEIVILQASAEPMANEPCGAIRARSDHAMYLESADTLLTGQHQVQNLEPSEQWIVRVLKDGADGHGKTVWRPWVFATLRALPSEGARLVRVNLLIAAARAIDALRPTLVLEISLAGRLVRKQPVKLRQRHLSGDLGFVRCVHAEKIAHNQVLVKSSIIPLF